MPLQDAINAYRAGDAERALALAGRQVALAPAGDFSAHAVLCEVLYRAGRIAELGDFLDLADDFQQDPRGRLMRAKAARRGGDLALAKQLLDGLLTAPPTPQLYRIAAFEQVAVLDAQGRHAAAWQVAAEAHRRGAARSFPADALVAALRVTAAAPAAELAALPKAPRRVATDTACVLGLPRSGTTLLEQMLDRHPSVCGVGELALPGQMADAMALQGGWPAGAANVKPSRLADMQKQYRHETRVRRQLKAGIRTLDKTVFPMLQPLFIAGVLPGAKVLRIVRDARDNAVSLFLNNFDPSWGWTGSLDAIRQVIAAERAYIPVILDKLRLDAVTLRFEDLVERPEPTLRGVLDHLGLGWDAACLQPHDNRRLVFTLSHEQVRRPLNRQGIDRWHHHREAFGADWDGLA